MPADRDPALAAAQAPAHEPYHPGLRVAALLPGEAVLVRAVRAWVARLREDRDTGGAALAEACGFGGAAAVTALDALDRLFAGVAAAGARAIDIRAPGEPTVGADEALLLFAVAGLQNGLPWAADRVAREWLPEAAAREARRAFTLLARHLGNAGFILPVRAEGFSSVRTAGRPPGARLQ